jgi:hypothetical protein
MSDGIQPEFPNLFGKVSGSDRRGGLALADFRFDGLNG